MALVPAACHPPHPPTCALSSLSGRQIEQNSFGQGRLYITSRHFHRSHEKVSNIHGTRMGRFCLPRKSQVAKVHLSMASLGSKFGGCPTLPIVTGREMLCKPTLDTNRQMVATVVGESPCPMSNGNPPVGFHTLVAPTTQVTSSSKSSGKNFAFSRNVHQQRWTANAPPQVAPNLHTLIRKILEKQQISDENISSYLKQIPSPERYQKAFEKFWHQCAGGEVALGNSFTLGNCFPHCPIKHQKCT